MIHSVNSVRPFVSSDDAQPSTRSTSQPLDALDLAMPIVHQSFKLQLPPRPATMAPMRQVAALPALRQFAPSAYHNALREAAKQGDTPAAVFAYKTLATTAPGHLDHNLHVRLYLASDALEDAQAARNGIGRIFVRPGFLCVPRVESERLSRLATMAQAASQALDAYDCGDGATKLSAELLAAARTDMAKNIVWSVSEASEMINNVGGSMMALASCHGIMLGLQRGDFDMHDPQQVAELGHHMRMLNWPHRDAVHGTVVVDDTVPGIVQGWDTWRRCAIQTALQPLLEKLPRIKALVPMHAASIDAVAQRAVL